jgi:hypothetical protein
MLLALLHKFRAGTFKELVERPRCCVGRCASRCFRMSRKSSLDQCLRRQSMDIRQTVKKGQDTFLQPILPCQKHKECQFIATENTNEIFCHNIQVQYSLKTRRQIFETVAAWCSQSQRRAAKPSGVPVIILYGSST